VIASIQALRTHVQHYEEKDLKLRRFVPIIRDSVVYPVILDSRRTVCSLPPIINAAMPAVSCSLKDPSHHDPALPDCSLWCLGRSKV